MNTKIETIKKMMAAVEKFDGKTNPNTKNTGNQSGKIDSLKEICLSLIFDMYLAT